MFQGLSLKNESSDDGLSSTRNVSFLRSFNLLAVPDLLQLRPCLHGGRVPRLGGLKHSPPLHATHLSGIVNGLSFERPLSTSNKMTEKRNVLAVNFIFLSLVPPAAAF